MPVTGQLGGYDPQGQQDERLGAVIFLAKGIDRYTQEQARMLDLLHDPFAMALANTLKHQEVLRLKDQLADDNKYLHSQLRRISGDEIIGSESGLKYVMDMVRQIAPQNSQALLLGETGTGKEIIANAIYYASPRADRPLIKVNCGAIKDIKTCADIPEGSLILDNIVRQHIRTVLKLSGDKVQGKGGAASLLDVHPNTLRYKMKKLGIPYGRKAGLCNEAF